MLDENFPYFIYMKTQICFFHFIFYTTFGLLNSFREKIKVCIVRNEKRKKTVLYMYKIWQILKLFSRAFPQAWHKPIISEDYLCGMYEFIYINTYIKYNFSSFWQVSTFLEHSMRAHHGVQGAKSIVQRQSIDFRPQTS